MPWLKDGAIYRVRGALYQMFLPGDGIQLSRISEDGELKKGRRPGELLGYHWIEGCSWCEEVAGTRYVPGEDWLMYAEGEVEEIYPTELELVASTIDLLRFRRGPEA